MSGITPTVSSLVEYGRSLVIGHENVQYKEYFKDLYGNTIIIGYENIVDKYHYTLYPHLVDVTMNEFELEKYRYQPNLFCEDFYGNSDLWSTLLRVNNILSRAEFDRPKIKVFTQEYLNKLHEILILEGDRLDKNRRGVDFS